MHQVYGIEGLDRLGKSTLIEGILDTFGYYEIIHFAKPKILRLYDNAATVRGVRQPNQAAYLCQRASFWNSMVLANSGAKIIFDRWHIGEVVYSPMYRQYSGDYVYAIEEDNKINEHPSLRLILLTENFEAARHFVDDGQSLGPIEKREEEQKRFIAAFNRSNIVDKKIICVTDPLTGHFRRKEDILEEAIS